MYQTRKVVTDKGLGPLWITGETPVKQRNCTLWD
jgi:hypothetical protein